MKSLINLQLSIPAIDELTNRTLMGGDGYIPENDFNQCIPDPEISIQLPEVEVIGDKPDIPNSPETDYDIPDPDMEMDPDVYDKVDSSDNQSDSDIDSNQDGHDNQDSDENNQGNTGDHGGSDGNAIPDWADVLLSHIFGPLQNYVEKLNLKFVINPDLPVTKEAQYNATTDTISLRSSDLNDDTIRSLTHELVHAVQDKLGLTDTNKGYANAEYQAYLITDIIYNIIGIPSNGTVGVGDAITFGLWLADLIKNDGSFNKDEFSEHWKEYFKPFMERYIDEPTYQSQNDNYDWRWNEIIDILFSDIKDEVGGVVILPGGNVGGQ